ncbi:MAG: glycosyltransferase family 4 protein [Candidatus Woesearchaeota archaeon]
MLENIIEKKSNRTKYNKKLYLIMRSFDLNFGSYSSVFEEIALYGIKKNYNVKILCLNTENKTKIENYKKIEIIRFPIKKIKIPFLGMNYDYLILAKHIKNYFSKLFFDEKNIILANGRAALGLADLKNFRQKYFVRIGQPAMTFLKNMEIANNKVSFQTKIARKIHFKFQSSLEKKALIFSKGIITPSIETKNEIFNQYNIIKPFFVPQSGIRDIFFSIKKEKTESKKTEIKMLFVNSGTEEIRKGIYYFKEALPKIFSLYPNLILIHVGDKIDWFSNLAKEYHSKIISYGKVPFNEMPKFYKKADFLISTALNEGMPNVILEAMASGLPVLSSDIQGINEYIENKKSGYIFKRADINSLLQGINFMLNADFKKLSMNARKKVQKLAYDNYLKELFNFFNNPENNILL